MTQNIKQIFNSNVSMNNGVFMILRCEYNECYVNFRLKTNGLSGRVCKNCNSIMCKDCIEREGKYCVKCMNDVHKCSNSVIKYICYGCGIIVCYKCLRFSRRDNGKSFNGISCRNC